MELFFYNKIGSIISIGDLPTTNIIEPITKKAPPCHRWDFLLPSNSEKLFEIIKIADKSTFLLYSQQEK